MRVRSVEDMCEEWGERRGDAYCKHYTIVYSVTASAEAD